MEVTDYLLTAGVILLAAGQLVAIILLIVVLITARKLLKQANDIADRGSHIVTEVSQRLKHGTPILSTLFWLFRQTKKGGK